jgi:hypothetical protein
VLTAHDGYVTARVGAARRTRGCATRRSSAPPPRPVRVAVPSAAVRPAVPAATPAQRQRGHGGRLRDQRGQRGRRRGDQPVRRRVLPELPWRTTRWKPRPRVRKGRVRRADARGRGKLRRARRAWEEVPAPGAVRPGQVRLRARCCCNVAAGGEERINQYLWRRMCVRACVHLRVGVCNVTGR